MSVDRDAAELRLQRAAEQAVARSLPGGFAHEVVSNMPSHAWRLAELEQALGDSDVAPGAVDLVLDWALHFKVQVVMLQCELFSWRDRAVLHRLTPMGADAPEWCSLDDLRNHQSFVVGLGVAWERYAGVLYIVRMGTVPPERSQERNRVIGEMAVEPTWRWIEPIVSMVRDFSRIRRNPEVHAMSPLIEQWLSTGATDQHVDWQTFMHLPNGAWENLIRSVSGQPGRLLTSLHMDGDEIAPQYLDQL